MNINTYAIQVAMATLFLVTIAFNITKRNISEAFMYGLQSLAIVVLLAVSFREKASMTLLVIALVTFVIKVLVAPSFFIRLIRQHEIKFTASSYASLPITLIVVALIVLLVNSRIFAPLTTILPSHQAYTAIALSSMLISIFLMVNRKGVLSQILGILSLENSIVAFAISAGLEQLPVLQIGLIFDIFVWMIIAETVVTMVYQHTGSTDVTNISNLKE